ncbi:dihydropteroate synthase [Parasediminibacterium sp. JCM 36343]|uniref:dihydropteroate synthase n=1 Tax=Parasediminibacterium sp. JCM 36343 TaxID=3374279 RepID=UPI00397D33D9
MGIINVTPDSFYAHSRQQTIDAVILKAGQLLQEGATILDIGGQTTRPGSEPIDADTEINRVVPVIAQLSAAFPHAYISIDTYYAAVAKEAVAAGAIIVNDISGGTMDSSMIPTVGHLNVPYICTHIQGTPKTMQQNPVYGNVVTEVLDFFIERSDTCTKAGIKDLIIDVGFGFGKTIEHNYQLLKCLSSFAMLGKPLLVGVSRKGMVYKPLGITAERALNGTTVLHTLALQQGANVLRVHDVKEAMEVVQLMEVAGYFAY